MSIRIAFASTDGNYVDQHFGSARAFQVFDIDGSAYHLVETRRTVLSCQGNCEGGFELLLKTLADCDAVFVMRIGPTAASFMLQHGKRVFEATGQVEEIIKQTVGFNMLDGWE